MGFLGSFYTFFFCHVLYPIDLYKASAEYTKEAAYSSEVMSMSSRFLYFSISSRSRNMELTIPHIVFVSDSKNTGPLGDRPIDLYVMCFLTGSILF